MNMSLLVLGVLLALVGGAFTGYGIAQMVCDALRRARPYAPEFAEHCDDTLDALGFQRAQLVIGDVPYVDSGHPKRCFEQCCAAERDAEVSWDEYEKELTW